MRESIIFVPVHLDYCWKCLGILLLLLYMAAFRLYQQLQFCRLSMSPGAIFLLLCDIVGDVLCCSAHLPLWMLLHFVSRDICWISR